MEKNHTHILRDDGVLPGNISNAEAADAFAALGSEVRLASSDACHIAA